KAFCTRRPSTASGGSSEHHQRRAPEASRIASAYVFPAERSEAARAVTSNQGWSFIAARNCCPAIPVAPTTATFLRIFILLARFTGRAPPAQCHPPHDRGLHP